MTIKRFLCDQRGAIIILAALTMPVFVGGLGLGAEAGYWYFNQRKLQNAADVAAYAGATQLRADLGDADINAAALSAALDTQFNDSIGTITVNTPPTSGAFAGDADAVEVVLQENVPRMFTAIFADGDVPMSGRAVAQVKDGQGACVLALSPGASGAVTFIGTANTILESCNVHANSLADDAVTLTGSGYAETPCASAVGDVSYDSGLVMTECANAVAHADVIDDPYADLPLPPMPEAVAPCEPINTFAGPPDSEYTISGGRYCGGLTMKRTVHMTSGVYVVEGPGNFEITSTADVDGTGVTVFLTGGAKIKFNGTANIQLSAPTSGTYDGMLMIVDPSETYDPGNPNILNGNSTSFFDGAIYAANGAIEYSGSNTVGSGCTFIVAFTVTFTGEAGLGTNCAGSSLIPIPGDQVIALVE